MLIRLSYGRRVQTSLKIIACLLVAGFYFAFLFRESQHAYENKKDKGALVSNALLRQEPKLAPRIIHPVHPQAQQQPLTTPATNLTRSVPSTLNPIYEYSEEIHSATERELQQRKAHLDSVCQHYNLQSVYPPNPWEFFISPGHNLVWCNVFKAASSTWMYYFNILGGYDIKFLQRTQFQPLELARKRFPRPEIYELYDSLPSALSFLFVREPFERIVSAYRNKLEGGRNSYYRTFGYRIVRQYRNHTTGPRNFKGPTFEEFARFLINQHAQKRRFDEHWAPVYSFCTPCSINFTIIGKLETFQRDAEYIIRQAGLESLLLGKLPRHKMHKIGNLAAGDKSDVLVERYFSEIDRNLLDQLLKIYRLDFELFDYNYTKYYEISMPVYDSTPMTAHRQAPSPGGANHPAWYDFKSNHLTDFSQTILNNRNPQYLKRKPLLTA